MKATNRIQSFAEFWPYYLGEHRNPVCRWMHFVGTGGFALVVLALLLIHPVRMGASCVGVLMVAFLARRIEGERPAGMEAVSMVVLFAVGSPWILCGIVWAYAWAWVGHFRVELNRPATFEYPLWSLFADFRMIGVMAKGGLWFGDSEGFLRNP